MDSVSPKSLLDFRFLLSLDLVFLLLLDLGALLDLQHAGLGQSDGKVLSLGEASLSFQLKNSFVASQDISSSLESVTGLQGPVNRHLLLLPTGTLRHHACWALILDRIDNARGKSPEPAGRNRHLPVTAQDNGLPCYRQGKPAIWGGLPGRGHKPMIAAESGQTMNFRTIAIWISFAIATSILALLWRSPLPGRADLVIGNGTDPGSLHPHRATGSPEGRIIRAIHEGLVLLDPATLDPMPGCAESWQISADGRHYQFQIQHGLRWSDGTPLDADDFVRSWLDLIDPLQGAPYGDLLESVTGARQWRNGAGVREQVRIQSLDSTLLEIEFDHPVPWFLYLCAQTPLQPVHPDSDGRAGPGIATNGPWMLTRWSLRDRIRIETNPEYRGPSRPTLKSIDFLAAESANTQLNIFAAGLSDWTVRVPAAAIPILRSDPIWSPRWRADPYLGISFYRLNLERPPLDDPAVRRALSLSIDRQQLCRDVLGGDPEPAYGFVPWPSPAIERQQQKLIDRGIPSALTSGLPGYRAMVAIGSEYNGLRGVIPAHQVDSEDWPRLGYDPRRARELLSEAGWRVPGSTEGREIPTLEILHPSGSTSSLVAQWLQLAWKRELGLDSTIQTLEWRSFLDVQRAVDYDISRSNWIADYPDPATFLTLFTSDSPNSRTGWSDSQYDRSVALALAEADPELRMQLWQQAEKILLERGPVLPLWSMTSGNLVSEDVTGFFANPLDQHDLRAIGRRSR